MSDSGEVFANLPAIVHFFSLARERATASGGRFVGTWGFKIFQFIHTNITLPDVRVQFFLSGPWLWHRRPFEIVHSFSFVVLPPIQLNLGPDFSAYIALQLQEMKVSLFFISPLFLFTFFFYQGITYNFFLKHKYIKCRAQYMFACISTLYNYYLIKIQAIYSAPESCLMPLPQLTFPPQLYHCLTSFIINVFFIFFNFT